MSVLNIKFHINAKYFYFIFYFFVYVFYDFYVFTRCTIFTIIFYFNAFQSCRCHLASWHASKKIRTLTSTGGGHVILHRILSNPQRQLQVSGHDGDSLGVNTGEIDVLEQIDKISFGGLLQRFQGGSLISNIVSKRHRYFPHESLKRQLLDAHVRDVLVVSNFAKSDHSGSITAVASLSSLHAARRRRRRRLFRYRLSSFRFQSSQQKCRGLGRGFCRHLTPSGCLFRSSHGFRRSDNKISRFRYFNFKQSAEI